MKVEEGYIDVLQNIESTVAEEYRRNPSLKDHDVLEAIQALVRRYAAEERRQTQIPSSWFGRPLRNVLAVHGCRTC
jgi:hypothetical protein